MRPIRATLIAAFAALAVLPVCAQPPGEKAAMRVATDYGKLPLRFEANRGQTDGRVQFVSRGKGYTLFLSNGEAVFTLMEDGSTANVSVSGAGQQKVSVVRLQWTGANPHPAVEAEGEVVTRSNYFLGNDPRRWRTNVPNYRRIRYTDIYPGIDLVYYGNQRQLEHDFVVAPGADPSHIVLKVSGGTPLRLDKSGDLVIRTAAGDLRMLKPAIYQTRNGKRTRVAGEYMLRSAHEVSFHTGDYDRKLPLVIDPVLNYCTYLGGSGGDDINSIAVDAAGNAYVTGNTTSLDFPTVNSFQGAGTDGFISKLSADGSQLIYSTYIGGVISPEEHMAGIAVNAAGEAFVVGNTASTDFPVKNALQSNLRGTYDAFITKLSADGSSLLFSTYYGGDDYDAARAVALDSAGNAFISGATDSSNFPVKNAVQPTYMGGEQDAFVAEISAAGTAAVYSTYLGGSNYEFCYAIAVGSDGAAYVAGGTYSTDFPVKNAFQSLLLGGDRNAFVTKLAPGGASLDYSTYLGGSLPSEAMGIAVNAAGNAFVTGETSAADFPRVNPFQSALAGGIDVFVSEFAVDGKSLVYSSFLGGSSDEYSNGIALDTTGHAYITGVTNSQDFPMKDAFINVFSGSRMASDVFVTEVAAGGSTLIYSSYFGGTAARELSESYGAGIAVDSAANAYIAGHTRDPGLPITANALQVALQGEDDGFVAKIVGDATGPTLLLSQSSLAFTADVGVNPAGQSFNISNGGTGTMTWTATKTQAWLSLDYMSGTAPSTVQASVDVSGLAAGTYNDTITITATGAAASPATIAVTLNVGDKPVLSVNATTLSFSAAEGGSDPALQSVQISNTGSGTLTWTATKTQPWLTLTPKNGTAPSALTVTASLGALAAGTYQDTITITGSGASGSPATIGVTFTVSGTTITPAVSVQPTSGTITTADPLSVAVTVTAAAGSRTPTGTVTLASGSWSANQTLTAGNASFSIPAGSLAAGTDTLTATYTPDSASSSIYSSATGSATVVVTETTSQITPTMTVTPSTTMITSAQELQVAVSVAGPAGSGTPTGTVTLSSGSYSAQQTLANGAASFTVPAGSLGMGNNTLKADYSGDSVFVAASRVATVIVAGVAASAEAPTPVSAGVTATARVTFTASNGYAGPMNLACSLKQSPAGAKNLPTCSVNPASISFSSGAVATAVLTMTTRATTTSALQQPEGMNWPGGAGTALAALLLLGLRGRRFRRFFMLMLLVAVAVMGGVSGCGGSDHTTSIAGTTAGDYVFAVTATDPANTAIQSATTVTLTVQ